MSDLAWWQTLASGAAGGAITLGGQWVTARFQSDAAREARADERRDLRAARREAFELTQLELLDAAVLRLSKAAFAYPGSEGATVEIADNPEGREFSEARGELQTLASRTLDQNIRSLLSNVQAKSFPTATRTANRHSGRILFEWVALVQQTRNAVGERIRTLYEHEGP